MTTARNFKQLTLASSPGLTGRSSIPETVRVCTRDHGVLDAPLEAGHDDRGTRLRILAACLREFWPARSALSNQRAQGMPGARCARCRVCGGRKHKSTRVSQVTGNTRHSPRNGFTVSFVLSPVIGLLTPVTGEVTSANLTPAPRRQDHTTSPSASAPFVKSASASTASRPAFVTIASRPSGGTG
jgi:hypothetical protein